MQDLSCLVRIGRGAEGKKGQKELDKLEDTLEKNYSGDLDMADLAAFDVSISLGTIKCSAIAEGEEGIRQLKENNPDAM